MAIKHQNNVSLTLPASFTPSTLSLTIAMLLGLGMTAVHAQTSQKPTENSLPEVRVKSSKAKEESYHTPSARTATKSEALLRDIPQTINVVPEQVLQDRGARSMQDVMKNIPGIGQSSGDGQRDQVFIRGFTAIADQFVDGIRDDALYFRDLSNVERVEVIKGPAAVLYGRGSSGGLINRVNKKPGIDLTEVAVSLGSWSNKRGEFDLARSAKNDSIVSWRLTGALEEGDSYRQQQFINRKAISPSVLFKFSPQTQLLVQADYLEDRRLTDFGIPAINGRPVDVDPGTYYGAANAAQVDYNQSRVRSLSAVLNHRFDASLSFRNATRAYHYVLDRNNTLPSGTVNSVAKTVGLTRSNIYRQEHGVFNQSELTQKFAWGSTQHELLYGLELGQQNKDVLNYSAGTVATVSLYNPVLPTLPFAIAGNPAGDSLTRLKTTALYVQDQISLNAQWKALFGLRRDRFEQDTDEQRINQPDLARTDNAWSPRAGLVWQPDSVQSYYASVSRSFQPSAESFALAANNADTAPEKTTNQEIGARYELFNGKASVTAALFRLERTNIKTTDPSNPAKLIPIGTQRTDGLELTFTGEVGHGISLTTGYAYLDATVIESNTIESGQPVKGKRATITPKHSVNFWMTQKLGNGFTYGAGLNYVDDRFANPGNTVTLPAYTTVDAMLQYRIDKTTLQLNLYNLFDRGYIISGHGSNPNLNIPGAPRNIMLSLRQSF